MRCGKAQEWLRMRDDEPRSVADQRRLATHMTECAPCAAYGRDLEQLTQLVAAGPCEEPSASFDWRLKLQLAKAERGELLETTAVAPAPWRARLQFGGAMAIAAAIVVSLGLATLRHSATQTSTTLARGVPIEAGGLVTPVRDPGPGAGTAANTLVRVPYAPHRYFLDEAPAHTTARADSGPSAQDFPPAAH